MTHDIGTEEAFHEIHLSGKQLVFLFMATTVVSVVIFLLGVLVGRGVPSRQAHDQVSDPLAGAVSAASAPAAAPSSVPEQTAAEAAPPSDAPPVPDETDDVLSYTKRLESDASAVESLSPRAEQRRPAPEPSTRPAARTTSAAAASSQTLAGSPQPGTWVVQVHALRDRSVAAGIVQRLAAKGYPAFLVAAGPPTGAYKVQVGRYKDRDEAQKVIERLKKEEQFKPWITR